MGKRQIAALETRRRIIAAAEKLIREKGFENVGVSDITDEAGVAKGSFYTYFRRKEDIVCEIAQNKFVSVEERAKTEGDVCGQISSFLTESMKYIVDTGLNICQQWVRNVAEPEDEPGKDKLAYDTGVIRAAFASAVERGELISDTPVDELADTVAAEYYGAVFVWAITDGKTDPLKTLETYGKTALPAMLDKYRA
jgi:AcrR family transcriptional regulator